MYKIFIVSGLTLVGILRVVGWLNMLTLECIGIDMRVGDAILMIVGIYTIWVNCNRIIDNNYKSEIKTNNSDEAVNS